VGAKEGFKLKGDNVMLRRAYDLVGFTIDATDGKIGHVADFYIHSA